LPLIGLRTDFDQVRIDPLGANGNSTVNGGRKRQSFVVICMVPQQLNATWSESNDTFFHHASPSYLKFKVLLTESKQAVPFT
jgi:hypothetical protein